MSVVDTQSENDSDSEQRTRIQEFQNSFNLNESEATKFKRWRHRVSTTDRLGAILFTLGIVLIAIFAYISDSGSNSSLITKAAAVSLLVVFAIFTLSFLVNFLHTAAIWKKDINSEMIAGYEINRAINEYQRDDERDVDNILYHLKEAQQFLSYSRKNRLLAPRHADAVKEYVSQLDKARNPEAEITETFPQFSYQICHAFVLRNNSQIEGIAKSIDEAPSASPKRWRGFREDIQSLLTFLVNGREGPILVALGLGIGVGAYVGFWRGATAFLGVLTIYSFIQDRIS